jgi:hypothetical protein
VAELKNDYDIAQCPEAAGSKRQVVHCRVYVEHTKKTHGYFIVNDVTTAMKVRVGSIIELCQIVGNDNHHPMGIVEAWELWCGPFDNSSLGKGSEFYKFMFDAMSELYPGFKETDNVTMVWYKHLGRVQ